MCLKDIGFAPAAPDAMRLGRSINLLSVGATCAQSAQVAPTLKNRFGCICTRLYGGSWLPMVMDFRHTLT
ncbi:hypothetical protein KSZ_13840 [Dictyobacter formicarum]|uniref:Uncharacterized protein n=1 Tax=Dictyobacter formicarum TaxID=2778368 RepID=A0ABQ3VCI9_9CHLR|nr:hypothetical protein KSZ_13840 [Dictyobacter formicarum]